MVLGDRTEDSFRQSMLLSGGDMTVFFTRPLAGTIMTLALLCLFFPLVARLFRRPTSTGT
jgi:TctA family transporter